MLAGILLGILLLLSGCERGNGVLAFAVHPIPSEADTHRGLYQSRDEGGRWEKILSDEIRAVEADPLRPERVYIGTRTGLFKSDGADWTAVGAPR